MYKHAVESFFTLVVTWSLTPIMDLLLSSKNEE